VADRGVVATALVAAQRREADRGVVAAVIRRKERTGSPRRVADAVDQAGQREVAAGEIAEVVVLVVVRRLRRIGDSNREQEKRDQDRRASSHEDLHWMTTSTAYAPSPTSGKAASRVGSPSKLSLTTTSNPRQHSR
jgi:hypothetical protein